ncbi:Peptidase A1 [Moelleriella libera RCEF 2490]|uniref:Peptidase A1 n=1 Tax=Moelleriella libera RCEF 2490 TaxID=1081109 RepID=A0A168C390_9HYPO|nr:Peptidase A1 [Moelleriella libera RCEF 2490]
MHAALALALLGSASASASTLQLPFRRLEHNITNLSLDLLARATPALRASNDPCVDGYVLDVLVGTPPQPMSLRSPDYRSGKILFGGIDAAQFTGPLSTVPLLPDHGPSFAVSVEGISLDGDNNNSSSSALPAVSGRAILEANSENMALPPALAHAINRRYGVVGVPCSFLNYTYYIADCGLRERLAHESISVRFAGGVAVKVPLGQLVIPYVNAATEERALEMIRDDPAHPMASWDGRCAWTLRPIEEAGENEGDDWILGAPFMRSAYVVFDTLNKQVGLAQAKSGAVSDDAETRIVPIPKDAKHFPA